MIRPDDLKNWESIKKSIKFRLKNELSTQQIIPSIKETMEDLVVEYVIDMSGDMTQAAVFPESILPVWGVSREEVIAQAKANVTAEPMIYMPLEQMLFGAEGSAGPHVVTSPGGCYGARQIMIPFNQEIISKEMGGDYYILPSSVHEVIILPTDGPDPEDLQYMVQSINADVVNESDWLSDNVYIYDSQQKEIKLAASQQKKGNWLESLQEDDLDEEEEKGNFRW